MHEKNSPKMQHIGIWGRHTFLESSFNDQNMHCRQYVSPFRSYFALKLTVKNIQKFNIFGLLEEATWELPPGP